MILKYFHTLVTFRKANIPQVLMMKTNVVVNILHTNLVMNVQTAGAISCSQY